MTKRKPDRRVLRTRKQLSESLMALILEKGYDAVTIEEITERADLGRTTFYLHYKDKDELLYKSLEAVFDDLVAQIEPYPVEEWPLTGERLSGMAFRHADENAHLYQIILSGQGGTAIAQRIREYIAQTAIRIIQTHYADHISGSSVPIEVLGNYIASSMMGLITWWLENGQPYTADEMHSFFQQLNFRGTAQTMGLPLSPNFPTGNEKTGQV
jgi:AcrR family transcriptional regulator